MGRATAIRLARNGDQVCICDLKAEAANDTAELIRSDGGRVFTGVVDVREQSHVNAWIAKVIDKFGKIDCLFSNAGVNARALVANMTLAQWSLLIDTHVTGTFNFCQAVLRHMVPRQSGAIVITSSDFAIVGVRQRGQLLRRQDRALLADQIAGAGIRAAYSRQRHRSRPHRHAALARQPHPGRIRNRPARLRGTLADEKIR